MAITLPSGAAAQSAFLRGDPIPGGALAQVPPLGWVEFVDTVYGTGVRVELGDGDWKVTGGYGGWDVIDRPQKRGLVEWMGRDPARLSGAIMIDGLAKREGVMVEWTVRWLEQLAGLIGDNRPPVITVNAGGMIPHDLARAAGQRWVIEALEWGEALFDDRRNRVRQTGTVTLLQYIEDRRLDRLALPGPTVTGGKPQRGQVSRPKTYKFKKGDTLQRIAARFYGSAKHWEKIAKKNGIRDPGRIAVGTVLTLP